MENKFKNGDIITNVFDSGIFKEYDKDTDKITFWIKITWHVDNPTIELNAVTNGVKHFTKATPREEIKVINFLHQEGYAWDESNGVLIDTYASQPYDSIRNHLLKNNWYINDETGECFLMRGFISNKDGVIFTHAFIDKDDFIHIEKNVFKIDGNWRPARKSEEIKLFERLNKVGYLWNEVKQQLAYVGEYYTEKKEFNEGDFIVDEKTNEVIIFKEQDYYISDGDKYYTSYYTSWASMGLGKTVSISVTNKEYSMYSTLRYATLPEIEHFLQVLKKNGYIWNNKTKQLKKK